MSTPAEYTTYVIGGTTGDYNSYQNTAAGIFDNLGFTAGKPITSVQVRAKDTATGDIRAMLYADDSGIDTVLWISDAKTPGSNLSWTSFDIADGSPTSLNIPANGKIWLATNAEVSGTAGYSSSASANVATHCNSGQLWAALPVSPFTPINTTAAIPNVGITVFE